MMQHLNQIIDEIEEQLTEEISIQQLSKKIGISEYHLKRTFSFIAGMSLIDYIRNRRFAKANEELLQGVKVIDIAFNYGYQSVEGFSRSFRAWCGYLPSEVIKNRYQKSFPKLTFYLSVKGGNSMKFKLEQKEAFYLVGVTKRVPIQFEGQNSAIQDLAQSITSEQKEQMRQLGDLYPNQVLHASYAFDSERMEETGSLTHLIGFATTQKNPYEKLTQIFVASHMWAIFPNQGPFPQTLQETWGKIYSEWLPSSNYELVKAPEISFTKFDSEKSELYSEIWIAVKEK